MGYLAWMDDGRRQSGAKRLWKGMALTRRVKSSQTQDRRLGASVKARVGNLVIISIQLFNYSISFTTTKYLVAYVSHLRPIVVRGLEPSVSQYATVSFVAPLGTMLALLQLFEECCNVSLDFPLINSVTSAQNGFI